MKTVAICSGKGGVGKTALACSIAAIIAGDQKRVLLFDGNLGLPNCDVYSGVEVGCTLGHIVRDGRELRDAVVPTKAGFDLISGGSGWKELAQLEGAEIDALVGDLMVLADTYDHVLIDCAPGVGNRVFPFLRASQGLMVVTTSEAASLMDGYALLKNAWDVNPSLSAGLVVNHVGSPAQGRGVASEVQGIVGQFLSQELEYWGSVRHDSLVARACAERRIFSSAFPTAGPSQDLVDAANAIMGLGVEAEATEEISMLGRIKSVFGKKIEDSEDKAA
jgi:flagellar biosynthesis protein FlhG